MKNFPLKDDDVQKILGKYDLGELNSVEEIKEGLINPVYLINGRYVLRIEVHAYEQNPNKLKRESILFRFLPKFGVPTPHLIGFDDSKEIIETPYMLLNFIPGKNLKQSFGDLNEKQQKTISYQLGETVKKIHSVSLEDIGVGNEGIFGNIEKWVAKSIIEFETYWQVVKDKNYLTDEVKAEILSTFGQFKNHSWDNVGRLTHGDFSPSNIQIYNGKIVGIFDFEYSFIADPLWDLQKLPLSFQLGPSFSKEEFLRGYDVTDFTDEEKIRLRMHCFHQGVWEIWATLIKFMPFGDKEIEEGKELINNTVRDSILH